MNELWKAIKALQAELRHLGALTRITYKKSTYTPTYLGGTTAGVTTYTFQNAAWTRKGNEITVRGQVVWTAATGTGNAQISLPFAPGTGNFAGSLYLSGVTFANSAPELLTSAGNTFFTMGSPLTNAAPTIVAIEAAGNITFTVTYFL